jgi:hypothetical protein
MIKLRKMIAVLANRCGLLSDFPHPRRTLLILFDPYRPELHYMRGPGPKWHAKHGKREEPPQWAQVGRAVAAATKRNDTEAACEMRVNYRTRT